MEKLEGAESESVKRAVELDNNTENETSSQGLDKLRS